MMISDAVSAIEREYEGRPDVFSVYYIHHTAHPEYISGPIKFNDLVQQMFDLDIRGWQVDRITEEPQTGWSPEFLKKAFGDGISIVIIVRIWCSREVLK